MKCPGPSCPYTGPHTHGKDGRIIIRDSALFEALLRPLCELQVDIKDNWYDGDWRPIEWLQIREPDGTMIEVHSVSQRMAGGLPYCDEVESDDGRTWKLVSYKDDTWIEVV